jgi:putative ABC transport system ATP-binding protein
MKLRSLIKLEGVWKIYKMGEVDLAALKGVSVNIDEGEFVAIVGSSGSGKSTMMNLVGCLDLPSKGSIFLDGKDISHLSESDLAQIRGKKIGFIFQQFNLIPNLSDRKSVV